MSAREKQKVCMLGATGVGKTSLVERFVSSIFHEDYRTTVGVKIQTREVVRAGRLVSLVIWDLSGEDEFQRVRMSYLRGAAGYLLVADGTRRETLRTAEELERLARSVLGAAPFVLVLNKRDRGSEWEIGERELASFTRRRSPIVLTSAKTGEGVEEAFDLLVDAIAARTEATP